MTFSQTHSAPASRKEVTHFFAVLILFWGSLYLFIPVMAPFAQLRGASLQTVGWLISAYGLVQLILRIPLGIWSDRVGKRRPFITYGFFASCAGTLGMALMDDPGAMILFRGLTGVGASMWIMFTVLYASRFPPARIAHAMGLVFMATHLTQLVSTLSGGLLAEYFGWEIPFLLASVLAAGGLILSLGIREEISHKKPPQVRDLVQVGRTPLLLTVSLLAALLQCLPYLTIHGFTPIYAMELGATRAALGLLSFAAGIPMATGAIASGTILVPRWGSRRVVYTGFAVAGAGVLLFPAANDIATLIVLQVAVGAGIGMVFPTLMALSIEAVDPERRATAMGFFQSVYAIGMFTGPVLGGFVAETLWLIAAFQMAALLAATGTLGSLLFLPAPPRNIPTTSQIP